MSNRSSFVEFIKTATCTVGGDVNELPAKIACDAYDLYKNLYENPEKVKLARALYKNVLPGYNKIAMEMVAANILADIDREKTAGLGSAVLTTGMTGVMAHGAYNTAKDNAARMHDNTNQGNIYSMGFNKDYKLKS